MYRNYLFVALILGFLIPDFSFAQPDTLNREDDKGFKQGYWIFTSEMLEASSCQAGKKVEEGYYKDGRRIGLWRFYHCSGRIKSEMTHREDKSVYCKNYYENGVIMEEGIWKNGDWVGKYRYFYESGRPFYDFNFDDSGKRTGYQKYYHENGNTMIDGQWADGKEAGTIREYNSSGALISEKTFAEGKLDEASVKTYKPETKVEIIEEKPVKDPEIKQEKSIGLIPDGFNRTYIKGTKLIEKEGEFRNQQLIDGKLYQYENGELKKIHIFSGGKKVREEAVNKEKNEKK
ncbi:MAG: hypothetical protein RLZZ46_111 [Bacteroidota bacterium]